MKCLDSSIVLLVLTALGSVETAAAQRGRRGPPEAVRTRMGAYFVDVTLPLIDGDADGQDRLAASDLVKGAAGDLSLLYLFDPVGDIAKHARFEPAIFNHHGVGVALRRFKCGRVDLTLDEAAMAKYGKRAPLFVAFDAKGKFVGDVSMRGYKVSSAPLVKLLGKAAKGHGKVPPKVFVKTYRSFLNDLTQLEGRKRALEAKRNRIAKKPSGRDAKLAKVQKEENELAKKEQKLLDAETKLLERAKVPDRDAKAERVGERRRGRRP